MPNLPRIILWKSVGPFTDLKTQKKLFIANHMTLTQFKIRGEGRGKKAPLPVFPLQLLQTYELAPKTFSLLVLTLLPQSRKIPSLYLVQVPIYLTWTKTTPQKKRFFWSNPYKIEVMITSLTETLALSNFGHMTTSTI